MTADLPPPDPGVELVLRGLERTREGQYVLPPAPQALLAEHLGRLGDDELLAAARELIPVALLLRDQKGSPGAAEALLRVLDASARGRPGRRAVPSRAPPSFRAALQGGAPATWVAPARGSAMGAALHVVERDEDDEG